MNNITLKKIFTLLIIVLSIERIHAQPTEKTGPSHTGKKIGILLTNHGSRSATWRNALLALEERVRDPLLKNQSVKGVKTAFMEYTEPSIATRLREFDTEGFTDVIIVPVFLTVSPHTFDDIPTIIGLKTDPTSLQMLKIEKIERYTPKANISITPTLDFPEVLKTNMLRRVRALSTSPGDEGLVMIAYGDQTYEKEWGNLLNTIGEFVGQRTGITAHSYGWCGHLVHYNPEKTTEAIEQVLRSKKRALVVPVLVAHDEMFQIKIIGDGIAKVTDNSKRVVYKPDSILPDKNIEQWVIDAAEQHVQKILASFTERKNGRSEP